MKSSKIAKIAAIAIAFGLVASATPAQATDLQGSGASFPALLIPLVAARAHRTGQLASRSP